MGAFGATRKTGSRLRRSHFSWPMLRRFNKKFAGFVKS
jgi:hypothetical protein